MAKLLNHAIAAGVICVGLSGLAPALAAPASSASSAPQVTPSNVPPNPGTHANAVNPSGKHANPPAPSAAKPAAPTADPNNVPPNPGTHN